MTNNLSCFIYFNDYLYWVIKINVLINCISNGLLINYSDYNSILPILDKIETIQDFT